MNIVVLPNNLPYFFCRLLRGLLHHDAFGDVSGCLRALRTLMHLDDPTLSLGWKLVGRIAQKINIRHTHAYAYL